MFSSVVSRSQEFCGVTQIQNNNPRITLYFQVWYQDHRSCARFRLMWCLVTGSQKVHGVNKYFRIR